MNWLIEWFAHNKVAANLMMVIILVAGILALQNTRKEILPNLALDMILIKVPYPGASPSEVEAGVIRRIESAIADISGIESLRASAREHIGLLSVKVALGFDAREVKEEVRSRIDTISNFPEGVGKPSVNQVAVRRDLVTNVVLYGQADERSLKTLAEKMQHQLLNLPSITQVEIGNVRPYEISINVSELALERYGLTFTEVAAAIKKQMLTLVSGSVSLAGGKSSILAVGSDSNLADVEDIVIRSQPDGSRLLLQDVAHVVDGFETEQYSATYNGQPAIYLSVFRTGSQNILKIAEEVQQFVDRLPDYLPDGIAVDIWQDVSRYYKSRIDLLAENALSGLAFLFFVLLIFLRWQLAFWVTAGIAVAFLGAFAMLPQVGGSFNMVSMFAFILVLGIVVDDGIIIGENIYTYQQRGFHGAKGVTQATQEVAKPVIFAALTTMVMFSPMLFLPGDEGKLMRIIPIIVIAILAFSLMEALFILPAHLSTYFNVRKVSGLGLGWVEKSVAWFTQRVFRPFLELCLHWRYTVTAVFLAILMVFIALLTGEWLQTSFFSSIEADNAVVKIRFPQGTPLTITSEAVRQYEQAAFKLEQQLEKISGSGQFKNVVSLYGQQAMAKGEHLGSVIIELEPSEKRLLSGEEIVKRWRALAGEVKGALEVEFETTLNQVSADIDLELLSEDPEQLRSAANALKVKLSEYEGVYDIQDDFEQGQAEVRIHLKEVAVELGLRLSDIAAQVRQAFNGMEINTLQRGQEEVKVMLRYAGERSLWHLENMHVLLPSGVMEPVMVPLYMVADVESGTGPSFINRTQGRRAIKVSAYVNESVNTTSNIMNDLKKKFLSDLHVYYPGVTWQKSGLQKNKAQFLQSLGRGFLIAVLVMYGLMATLFRSYSQPLMVLSAVPFGVVGALAGHLILGLDVTLWSLVGMTAVSGVVVNDNLVLVDYINRMRKEGQSTLHSIRDAGVVRFRAIILTTLTTFGGLTPLLMERSVQAKFLIPMAASLAFGVLFATLVTLILVPVTYHILEDIKHLLTRWKLDEWFFPKPLEAKNADGLDERIVSVNSHEGSNFHHPEGDENWIFTVKVEDQNPTVPFYDQRNQNKRPPE